MIIKPVLIYESVAVILQLPIPILNSYIALSQMRYLR